MTKFLHFNVEAQTKDLGLKLRKKFQSRTLAAEPPSAATVRLLVEEYLRNPIGIAVNLKVGMTFVSLKDRYNKKTGRAEATARMKDQQLSVIGVSMNETHLFVHLHNFQGVKLGLRTNRKTGFTTVVGAMVG